VSTRVDPSPFLRPGPQRGALARRSLFWIVLGATLVFALLVQLGENGLVAWWHLRTQTARLEGEVQELEEANAAQAARLHGLTTDPGALETLAREEYGMRRPDEEVLVVRRPDAPSEGKPGRLP